MSALFAHDFVEEAGESAYGHADGVAVGLLSEGKHGELVGAGVFDVQEAEYESVQKAHGGRRASEDIDLVCAFNQGSRLAARTCESAVVDAVSEEEDDDEREGDAEEGEEWDLPMVVHMHEPALLQEETEQS